jgi:hypothetical protein
MLTRAKEAKQQTTVPDLSIIKRKDVMKRTGRKELPTQPSPNFKHFSIDKDYTGGRRRN